MTLAPVSSAPDYIDIGPVVRLRSLSSLASALSTSVCAVRKLVDALSVPVVSLGAERYVNETMLEIAFICLSYLGQPGYAAPGSKIKGHGHEELPRTLPPGFPSPTVLSRALSAYSRLASGRSRRAIRALNDLIRGKVKTDLAQSVFGFHHPSVLTLKPTDVTGQPIPGAESVNLDPNAVRATLTDSA